ncbi:hypothetical protein AAMO2058_000110300 [Amorphochlora amoebiformis]
MSGPDPVQRYLRGAGLERFYPNFLRQGITESKFVDLIVSDYQGLGISDLKDRQKLFRLIQFVKKQKLSKAKKKTPPGPPSIARATSHEMSASPTTRSRSGSALSRLSPSSQDRSFPSAPSSPTNVGAVFGFEGARRRVPLGYKAASLANDDLTPMVRSFKKMHANSSSMPRNILGNDFEEPQARVTTRSSPNLTRRKKASKGKSKDDSHMASSNSFWKSDTKSKKGKKKNKKKSRIMVCVRKRPLNEKEKAKGDKDIALVKGDQVVQIVEHRKKVDLTKYTQTHKFVFDRVFNVNWSNERIYEETCKPLVEFFFDKGRATCFAYGQTGSGKTYTMMGPEGGKQRQNGLYVLASRDIFLALQYFPKLSIEVSFFEIYGGKFYDLLNGRKRLQLQEDAHGAVHTVGLKQVECRNADDLIDQILRGNGARKTGGTSVHQNSSRSHAVLQITAKNRKGKVHGTYSFIDLAGCERASDTQKSDRQRRIEGAEINKSLLALKECIRALDQKASHLPFRGSKLTQVLKDSFVGNCRTVMIATIAPGILSTENSLNTLRYADRVKEMKEKKKNKSKINAYMPHSSKGFAKADKPKTPSPDSDDDDDNEAHENRVAEISVALGRKRGGSHGNNLSRTWGAQQKDMFAKAMADARKQRDMDPDPDPEPEDDDEEIPAKRNVSPKRSFSTYGSGIKSGIPGLSQVNSKPKRTEANIRGKPTKSIDDWGMHNRRGSELLVPADAKGALDLPQDLLDETEEDESQKGARSPTIDEETAETAAEMLDYYQQICSQILEEEAAILDQHRRHIHETMLHVKEEMELLKKFESKRLSIDDYVASLEDMEEKKGESTKALSERIATFKAHLKEEEILSKQIEDLDANM